MKTVYIPKGETVHYESLVTDRLVVKGCLKVTYGVKAKTISGSGVISAGTVEADIICADSVETASVFCKRLIAKRVQAPEVYASESAVVSCFLSASYVETGKLTVTISEVDEVKATEIVNLTPKKRSLLGTLLASALRSFWTSLTVRPAAKVVDAPYKSVEDTTPEKAAAAQDQAMREEIIKTVREVLEQERAVQIEADERDFELKRLTALFKLLRKEGYTLRVISGTPEENAPVFELDTAPAFPPAA